MAPEETPLNEIPIQNNNGTFLQWLIRIDQRLEGIEAKLDRKVDKTEHLHLVTRIDSIEDKVQGIAIKIAGIAGGVSVVIWVVERVMVGFIGQ